MTDLSPIHPPAATCDPAAALDTAAPAAATLPASVPPIQAEGTGAGFSFSIPGCGPGGSVSLVLQKRLEQAAKGYTVAADLRLPLGLLAEEARRYLVDARDWLDRPGRDADRRHYEGKLVNAGALILAELDRLHASRACACAQVAAGGSATNAPSRPD